MHRTVLTLAALAAAAAAPAMTQAQPAPAAPAAPACAREFVLYFPVTQAGITTDGQNVVRTAAGFAGAAAGVLVTGHSDASEPAVLSMERTGAVSDALVKAGIANSRISIAAVGADKPAIPSPGPEPLNRRAVICVKAG